MGEAEDISCQICRDIWQAFLPNDTRYTISLGSFETATSSKCPTHTPLLQAFKGHREEISPHDELEMVAAKQDSHPNHLGTGRILDPNWVDVGILKKWKDRCMSLHGSECENPMRIQPASPDWLIDVEKKCLVPLSALDRGRFVALSYFREDEKESPGGFRVDDPALIDNLQRRDILDSSSPEISERLLPIIQHAMYLTSTMGERYLWADALCAIHGDAVETDAAAQLDLRSAIYASAVVTIISTARSSQNGIPGLQGVSNPRNLEQRVIPFGNEKIAVRNTGVFSMGALGPYHKRGWTYQEYKMSPRKLLFMKNELHWECQCSVWHEELTLGTEIDQYIDPRLKVILAGFPDIGSLGHALCHYNGRELSYDEDALPGISGLLSVLSRSFEGGFLYGLPEMFFERALGWSPFWQFTNLRRRTVSDRYRSSGGRLPGVTHLPSWSWIGWQGMVNIGQYEAMRTNRRVREIQETIPITEWYTSKTPSGDCSLRRIRSTWFENRDAYKDFSRPLPPGWTRHDEPPPDNKQTIVPQKDEPYLYLDGCGDYHFKHPRMTDADDDCDTWYYPFPVPEIQPSTRPFMPEQTPYLHCKTERATLWARRSPGMNFNELKLFNKSGSEVGKLHLHNEEQREGFPKENGGGGADDGPGKPVELVAIYRSRRRKKIFDEEQHRFARLSDVWETYEVLWVEWKEGVAYRLAAGHVRREHWEQLDLEEISLVLG